MSDTDEGGRIASPIRETDDAARAKALDVLRSAQTAALGVLSPGTGHPLVTRVALLCLPSHGICSLISDLSQHAAALRVDPRCSLLIGEPGARGDSLNHPRLTLQCTARVIDKTMLRDDWLAARPKAKLYFDFADFNVFRFEILEGFLNGGFGKAFLLGPEDLQVTR